MEKKQTLDFDDYLDADLSILIGRENGKELLEKLKWNGVNILEDGTWIISIPERIITINNSFFRGFFYEAFEICVSTNNFFNKYGFECSNYVRDKISNHAHSLALRLYPEENLESIYGGLTFLETNKSIFRIIEKETEEYQELLRECKEVSKVIENIEALAIDEEEECLVYTLA